MTKEARFQALKRVGYSIGPSTLILSAGLAMHSHPAAASWSMIGYAAAAGAGYIGFKKGWPVAFAFAGAFAYVGVVTWFGVDWATFWAWLTASTGAFGARLWFEHHSSTKDLDKKIKLQRYAIGEIRAQSALMRLEKQLEPEYVPNLRGFTQEETALRTAIWDVFKEELLGAFVEIRPKGYRAVLGLPSALDRNKLRTNWHRVAGALAGTGKYLLRDGEADNQLIITYTEGAPFPAIVPYIPSEAEKMSDPVYLGPDLDGNDTLLTILGRHTLILGTSGNGKSVITNQIVLAGVRRGAAVIGIDMKRGVELAPMSPLLATLAKDGDQAREVFDWLDAETDRRAEIMIREGVSEWDEEYGPYILVITDELSELTDKKWKVDGLPTLAELLASGSRIWRAFGIHLISATQAPSRHAFGGNTDARTNYKNRIGTRVMEAAHAQFGFGQSWKSDGWDLNGMLSGPGEFMLSNDDYPDPIVRKAPFLTKELRAAEVGRLLNYKVELDGSPWGEGGVPITVDTRVLNLLRNRGNISRQDIETGLGLSSRQVYDAIKRLRNRKGIEIAHDQEDGTYYLATEDPRELVPLVSPPG